MTTIDSLKSFSQFEYQGWKALSSDYHQCWGHVTSAFLPIILDEFDILSGMEFLDIATGPGYGAGLASNAGAKAVGVDFSEEMIAQAKDKHPNAEFFVADALDLPFCDSQFDLALSNFGFQHFSNPLLVLTEVARVLKPNGILKFTLWAEKSRNSASLILEEALEEYANEPCSIPEGPDYHSFFYDENFKSELEILGFDSSSMQTELHVVPWVLNDPDELFRAELSGSVRSGAQLRQESEGSLENIRRAMRIKIEESYNENLNWVLPMAAYVVTAKRKDSIYETRR